MGDVVKLQCRHETIGALASKLTQFGPIGGEPEWLVSAVWLSAGDADYLATSSTKVLSDGYIARPLAIDRVDDLVRQLRIELPDISARLVARGSGLELPEPQRPERPKELQARVPGPYATRVLMRVAARAASTHEVACGLLFDFQAGRLLIGTDLATPAMVLSDDDHLIDRYVATCQSLSADDYLARYA